MTLPIEKGISVMAGGNLIAPGMYSSPVIQELDWDGATENGLYIPKTEAMSNSPFSTGVDFYVITQNPTDTTIYQLAVSTKSSMVRTGTVAGSTVTWKDWEAREASGSVVQENITSDITINLEDKWDSWKNNFVFFTISGNIDPVVTIQPNVAGTWMPPTSDRNSFVIFHPLWEGGRIRFKNIGFTRHDSDGGVSEHTKASTNNTPINATEGLGEPFRLIFADYYVNGTLWNFHVAPLTQDIRSVLSVYDKTAVHEPELKSLNNKLDHLLAADGDTEIASFWPTFTVDYNSAREVREWDYRTFGTEVKIIGAKGDHNIYVQTKIGSNRQRESLKDIFIRLGIRPGRWTNNDAFVYFDYSVNGSDDITTYGLAAYADVASGRLRSPLPADIDKTIIPTSGSSGRSLYQDLVRIYGYNGNSAAKLTNKVGTGSAAGIAGDNKLRIFGTSTDLAKYKELVQDHLGSSGRAVVAFQENDGEWKDYHISAFGDATISTTGNMLLNYSDITFIGVSAETELEASSPLRIYLGDINVSSWAQEGDTARIPLNKVPITGLGNVKGDHIATLEPFKVVQLSGKDEIIKSASVAAAAADRPTFSLADNVLSSTYETSGRYLNLPEVPRGAAQIGYYLETLNSEDEVISVNFLNFSPGETTSIHLKDSANKVAGMQIFVQDLSDSSGTELTSWRLEYFHTPQPRNAAFSATETFSIKVYEWIDSAHGVSSSGSGALAIDVGSGAFDILRRQENVAIVVGGTQINVGGTSGLTVDEGATHLDVSILSPNDLLPADGSITWLYQDPGDNVWRNLLRPGVTSSVVTFAPNKTTSFRFSEVFMHTADDGTRSVKTRIQSSSGSVMSGSDMLMVIDHEKDVNSAAIKPLTLLRVPVVVQATTLASNLAGASFSEVGLDVPIEWDLIDSLTILLGTNRALEPWEDAVGRLIIPKDEIDHIGNWTSTDSLSSTNHLKGWFSVGWAHTSDNADINSFRTRMSTDYVYHWANTADSGVPSRLIALKRDGAYLTGILVAPFRQQCYIEHISCLRRL